LVLVASVAARTPSAIFLSAVVGLFGARMEPKLSDQRRKMEAQIEIRPAVASELRAEEIFGWWICGSGTRCNVLTSSSS
jgi:hypothetical protein